MNNESEPIPPPVLFAPTGATLDPSITIRMNRATVVIVAVVLALALLGAVLWHTSPDFRAGVFEGSDSTRKPPSVGKLRLSRGEAMAMFDDGEQQRELAIQKAEAAVRSARDDNERSRREKILAMLKDRTILANVGDYRV